MRQFIRLPFLFGAIVALSLEFFAQSSQDQIRSVSIALRARRFSDALRLLESALRSSPSDSQLWTLQGLAYSGNGQNDEALLSYRHALQISPNYLPALEGAAQLEFEAGSPEVSAHLRRVLQIVPNDSTANAMMGSLAFINKDCNAAIPRFEKAGNLLRSHPLALRQYGICLARAEKYKEAIPIFESVLALPQADSQDRMRLATVQISTGDSEGAIRTLQPLLENHPDSAALSLAAKAYEEQKQTPEAVKCIREAIVQNPRDVNLYLQFADISFVHQSYQVGITMIGAGLQLQPDAAALYLARGILYVQVADYEHAEADFIKANELDPKHSVSDVARGMVAEQKGDLDKALSVVRRRLAKQPDDPALLYVKADILVQQNPDLGSPEFNEAVSSAKRATVLNPGLVAARDVLANLYLQAGKDQLAVQESRESLRRDSSDQVAIYHLMVGLRRTGHKEELPALLQRLSELRQKATRVEAENNRYKLIEETGEVPIQSRTP